MSLIKPLGIQKIKRLKLGDAFNFNGNNDKNTELFEVKSIKLLTPLDEGSANDGKEINKQLGMVYGNNYSFQVTEYMGKKPHDLSKIKWEMIYHDLDDNEWKELPISNNGDLCTINMSNVDTCGRFVYIRAYINDKKNDAVLKIWKHNRFRWFDSKKLHSEIEERKRNSWKIDQNDTNTCGPSSIMYVFAKKFSSWHSFQNPE